MMARYIDAEELCRRLNECWETNDIDKGRLIQQVIDRVITPIVVGTPTADVVEVKHGEWKHKRVTIGGEHYFCCSECGREVSVNIYDNPSVTKFYPYCHCGVKMDGNK